MILNPLSLYRMALCWLVQSSGGGHRIGWHKEKGFSIGDHLGKLHHETSNIHEGLRAWNISLNDTQFHSFFHLIHNTTTTSCPLLIHTHLVLSSCHSLLDIGFVTLPFLHVRLFYFPPSIFFLHFPIRPHLYRHEAS